jgi:hypothetical protein
MKRPVAVELLSKISAKYPEAGVCAVFRALTRDRHYRLLLSRRLTETVKTLRDNGL